MSKKIIVTNAKNDFCKFVKYKARIVKIYNEASNHYSEKEITDIDDYSDPQHCMTFTMKGITGGIYVEKLLGQLDIAVISFAGIDKTQRSNGYLRDLINFATIYLKKENSKLCVVQLNDFDEKGIWQHLGFNVEEIMHTNGTIALINVDIFNS